jgi:hypothetical protein
MVGALVVSVDSEPYGVGSTITWSAPRDTTRLPASMKAWSWARSPSMQRVTSHAASVDQSLRACSTRVPVA